MVNCSLERVLSHLLEEGLGRCLRPGGRTRALIKLALGAVHPNFAPRAIAILSLHSLRQTPLRCCQVLLHAMKLPSPQEPRPSATGESGEERYDLHDARRALWAVMIHSS